MTIANCLRLKYLSIHARSFARRLSNVTADAEPVPSVELDPLESPDRFGLRDLVTVKDLFQCRAHFGHHSMLRNEHMIPYIFGTRQGVDIIDLEQTNQLLFEALNFTAHIAYRQGIILFVSQNQQMLPLVERTARDVGEYSCCRHWVDGLFTDSEGHFGQSIRLPDLVILLSTLTPVGMPHPAVTESAKMLIPTVGIVDTNADPRLVTYPVPGNDDSPATLRMWCAVFSEAIRRAKRRAERDEKIAKVMQSDGAVSTSPTS